MRKKIIFLVMALMSLAYTSKAESVKINDFAVTQGETITVTLDFTNTRPDLTAFSIDLTLPEGLTLVEATATDRYAGEITVGQPDDNVYKICGLDANLGVISGTSGALLELTFKADERMRPGTYEGLISNVEFITSTRLYVRPGETPFTVTIEKGTAALLGDANEDGFINMSDVTFVINYILGKSPSPFVFANADVTDDGYINMSDVTAIINIILGK